MQTCAKDQKPEDQVDPRRSAYWSDAQEEPGTIILSEGSTLSESGAYQYHQLELDTQLQHVVTPIPVSASAGTSSQFMVLESSPDLLPSADVTKFHSCSLTSSTVSALSAGSCVQNVVMSTPFQHFQAAGVPHKAILTSHNQMWTAVKKPSLSSAPSSSANSVLDVTLCLSIANKLLSGSIACEGKFLNIPGSPKQIKMKLDKTILHENTGKRKKIVDHLTKKIKLLQLKYYNEQAEYFFLKNGGNVVDYIEWKKKCPTELINYLCENKFDEYDDLKTITDCLTKTFSEVQPSGSVLLMETIVKSSEIEDQVENFKRTIGTKDYTDWNFINFENVSNLCWLNASMALLAHNQTMSRTIEFYPNGIVTAIITGYDDAISVLNDTSYKDEENRLNTAKEILLNVQKSALKYLTPILKYQMGRPDSAFCSLLNFIKEEKLIQSYFDVAYAWHSHCDKCEMTRWVNYVKPIITINFVDTFVPENHISSTYCFSCHAKPITMKLVYKKIPGCLLFHFENGAGNGTDPLLAFHIQSRKYQLTCIIILKKGTNVNHFITYIRNPFVDKWLQCNDLNRAVQRFSTELPNLSLKDVYLYVYEAFDDLGTIIKGDSVTEEDSSQEIPVIDIEDEVDTNICNEKSTERICASEPERDREKIP